MGGIIDAAVRLIEAGRRAYAQRWSFLGFFATAFFGSVLVLGELDLLPNISPAPVVTRTENQSDMTSVSAPVPVVVESPMKIEILKINLSATIANPETTSVEVLDGALLKGAVHYPTSARLGEDGNVVLFGHSSYLPVVGNQAYKTFNGIQKLAVGDLVTVSSDTTAYTYSVRSVAKENTSDGAIPLAVSGKVLTLATCNSFATKEDRFVIVADFVESHSISS